jgi:DNA-binding PadR family transcriptional regulator
LPDACIAEDIASVSNLNRTRILQHFEHAVLLSVNQLGERAFPAEIARRLTSTLQRHVSLAQVFTALERMEDRGLVTSKEILPEPVRGGRRRRVFQLKTSGELALRTTAATLARMASPLGETDGETQGVPSPA